jgi:hypothetical protein
MTRWLVDAGNRPSIVISTASPARSSSKYPAGVPRSYATHVSSSGRSSHSSQRSHVHGRRSIQYQSAPTPV